MVKMVKRKDLKPGMTVRSLISGNLGQVRADPNDQRKLRRAHPEFVAVRVATTGKGKGYQYPCWRLENVELT